MNEKRFIFATNEKWFLFDNETEDYMDMEDCKDKLNEQQDTINELQDTVYDELDKALKVLGEIYEDYPKNNVYNLYNNLKGLKEMME